MSALQTIHLKWTWAFQSFLKVRMALLGPSHFLESFCHFCCFLWIHTISHPPIHVHTHAHTHTLWEAGDNASICSPFSLNQDDSFVLLSSKFFLFHYWWTLQHFHSWRWCTVSRTWCVHVCVCEAHMQIKYPCSNNCLIKAQIIWMLIRFRFMLHYYVFMLQSSHGISLCIRL